MAELILLRHGQASFGSDNYDCLSDLGHRQAKMVTEFLGKPDAVYAGSLSRQQDTAAPFGVPVITDSRFNEVQNEEQIHVLGPKLAESNAELRALFDQPMESKTFQKMIEIVFQHWVIDQPSSDELMSWIDFRDGAYAAMDRVMAEQGGGGTTVVCTSGGVIATLTARVLGLPDAGVYQLFEPMINASITRLFYNSAGKVSLSCFNDTSHLKKTDPVLISYR